MGKLGACEATLLAAAVALVMGTSTVMAGTPPAAQLPGHGTVVAGTAITATPDSKTLNITLAGASAVINWGSTGGTINASGAAGFNIGSAATVNFSGATGVLNIDSSGSPSQIFGTLTAADNVFVANANGIIVGAGAAVSSSGQVGLVANTLAGANGGFTGTTASLGYNGSGGDVTVQPGASLGGSTVLIAGGRNVNIDLAALTSGSVSVAAGMAVNGGSGAYASATVVATGIKGSATIAGFSSAGTASNAGTLDLSGVIAPAYSVVGLFDNTGDLTVPAANGAVSNHGHLTTTASGTFSALTNAGIYATGGALTVTGGDLINTGTLTGAGTVILTVVRGDIVNRGSVTGFRILQTWSDANFTPGADYSITNTGTISGANVLQANFSSKPGGAADTTTGSVSNTGTLDVPSGKSLNVSALNNVNLGGMLEVDGTATSVNRRLAGVVLRSGVYGLSSGVLTVSTPVFFNSDSTGSVGFDAKATRVRLMSNIAGFDRTTGAVGSFVNVWAGAAVQDDYAIRIGSGKTLSAASIYLSGTVSGDNPNVILQGTLSADNFLLGSHAPLGNLFAGPDGRMLVTGTKPQAYVQFTGALKTAPYLNDRNNFRYNFLPIIVTDASKPALKLELVPVAYATNGTSNGLSALNILVGGDVQLTQLYKFGGREMPTTINGTGSALTGASSIPNTHLVLQATGSISTQDAYYWPGFVYLGTIDSNESGAPLPGTLGSGKISLNGRFSNVLPGNTDSGGGIHFITKNPLTLAAGATVTTNANSWVNFGTSGLTADYASGTLHGGSFFGGTSTGNMVNYGALDASMFHSHPPVAAQ